MSIEASLSYDDVLLVPKRSPVESREHVDTTAKVTPEHSIDVPIVSAPMDSVTESETATAMSESGGVGMIHRFLDIEDQAQEVENSTGIVSATIGIGPQWDERSEALLDAGVDFLCLDIAHAHLEPCLDVLKEVSAMVDIPVIVGNVATEEAVSDLYHAGADGVKIGIGPGSHCTTRVRAGVGVPQISAIQRAERGRGKLPISNDEFTLIADGGIQSSGDIVKALMVGADAVMIGGLLAGCKESPAPVETHDGQLFKITRGMASESAREDNEIQSTEAVEGAEGLTRYKGPVSETIESLAAGVRSGLSYCGGHTIPEARKNAELVRVTPSTKERNGTHGVYQDEK